MSNLLNMLSDDANQGSKPRKEVIQILIGKAWVKADKSFKIAPITIPDPDNEGQYIVAPVYPLLATDYTGSPRSEQEMRCYEESELPLGVPSD